MKDTILGPGAIEWPGGNYRTTLATADAGGAMSITDSVSLPGWGRRAMCTMMRMKPLSC